MRPLVLLTVLLFLHTAHAQKIGAPALKPQRSQAIIDTEIASMARDVSADSIRGYIQRLVSFETRHSLSDTLSDSRGIGAARRYVAQKFRQLASRSAAEITVQLDPFTVQPSARVPYAVTMKNVLAIMEGSDPKDSRVLIVSAHLDTRNSEVMDSLGLAPGANDDGSGVAVVLELARIMAEKRYPCSLIFMTVQGEEQGLLGARHMAAKLKTNGSNVVAMLNNDIVGNTVASETGDRNEKTVRIFSEMIPAFETPEGAAARNSLKAENDSPSRQLARYVKETGDAYFKQFSATLNARPDRLLRGGDHSPFNQAGFSAVRFTEFHEDYDHQHQNVRKEKNIQYGDLPQFLDYEYIANVARLNLVALASLAKAPAEPVAVKMKVALGNITELTWKAPESGPAIKGYYILMRETIQPYWEKKFFVENTHVSLPYSKDNYFFAVQSVGVAGHTSQAVIPIPER